MKRLVLVALAACAPPGSSRRAPLVEQDALIDMVGGWRWLHRTEESESGTVRLEDETWRLHYTKDSHLAGQYLRTVEVRSTDRLGFACNQQPWYRQRAVFDVEIEADGAGGFVARETGYHVEPTPCDHEFRHVSTYEVVPRGNRLELHFDGGMQTLWQVDRSEGTIDASWDDAPPAATPSGAWRWQTRSYADELYLREEAEWWDITARGDDKLDGTYRRRVTVRSVDGAPIECAGAPSYSFDDAYVFTGQREEEHWRLVERAVDAGSHPCLAPTPGRNLDEATAQQIGDFVVIEWRGKRRQVLHRPDVN
jgi:hypothetical protein